jgi:hypothetical protein
LAPDAGFYFICVALNIDGGMPPEKGKYGSWARFSNVTWMAEFASLDELHSKNMAELWANSAEFRNGQRWPHHTGGDMS